MKEEEEEKKLEAEVKRGKRDISYRIDEGRSTSCTMNTRLHKVTINWERGGMGGG